MLFRAAATELYPGGRRGHWRRVQHADQPLGRHAHGLRRWHHLNVRLLLLFTRVEAHGTDGHVRHLEPALDSG